MCQSCLSTATGNDVMDEKGLACESIRCSLISSNRVFDDLNSIADSSADNGMKAMCESCQQVLWDAVKSLLNAQVDCRNGLIGAASQQLVAAIGSYSGSSKIFKNISAPEPYITDFNSLKQYLLISQAILNQIGPASQEKAFWHRFWKFRVPQRAKHFAWRLLTDSLPTSANLRKRTMEVSISCPLCQEENGTALHLFFECAYAKRLWQSAGLLQAVESARKSRAETWFRELLTTYSAQTAELFIMFCDSLWFQRNQRIFTDRKLEADYLTTSVSRNLQTFHSANGWPERTSELLAESSLLRPLPTGPKIMFDAGINNGKAGLAAVMLDSNRAFTQAIADVIPGVTDALYAEARALQMAVELAAEPGNGEFQIVGDCLFLIRMVRDEDEAPPHLASLVADIKSQLASGRLDMPCWTSRDQNKVADSVASYAKLNLSGKTTWNTSPEFLLSTDAGLFQ